MRAQFPVGRKLKFMPIGLNFIFERCHGSSAMWLNKNELLLIGVLIKIELSWRNAFVAFILYSLLCS